jgi:hypothetical protein
MSQLTTMATSSGAERCFKCPYHATVMKVLVNRTGFVGGRIR